MYVNLSYIVFFIRWIFSLNQSYTRTRLLQAGNRNEKKSAFIQEFQSFVWFKKVQVNILEFVSPGVGYQVGEQQGARRRFDIDRASLLVKILVESWLCFCHVPATLWRLVYKLNFKLNGSRIF